MSGDVISDYDDDDDMTIMMSGDVISDYDLSGAVFSDRPLFHPQCSCPAQ